MKILVTGSAGFIGFYVVKYIMQRGDEVVGLDNINDYYDVHLKYARLKETGILQEEIEYNKIVQSEKYKNYRFIKINLEDRQNMFKLFSTENFDKVCHLAAQAGVRYSIENPYTYIDSNILGFINILEVCRHYKIQHLVYASSSSVYGNSKQIPYSEDDCVDEPLSLYAATKKTNELMSYTYSHLYNIPTTGLRFFTVYGPWGRPDMAPILFTKAIINNEPIKVFNNGKLSRDFTYIDDIVDGVIKVIDQKPENNPPYKIYNIGCSHPIQLMDFIATLESALGKKAIKKMLPMQQGDVYQTYADTSKLERDFGYKPKTSLEQGVNKFVSWFISKNCIK